MSFIQLKENEIADKAFFSSRFPLINAVKCGEQQGEIFASGDNFFIIHKAGFSFFKTENDFSAFDKLLEFLIQAKDIPKYFHVYDPPKQLVDECRKNNLINIRLRERVQLKFTDKHFRKSMPLPHGYFIERITEKNFDPLAVFDLDIAYKFWKSKDDFLDNGFGFSVFNKQQEPLSVCYAACVSNNEAEIDVATLKPHEQQGLAKAAVSAFVNHSVANHITPNWDCFKDNRGSLKTAHSIGFESVFNYEFISIYKQTKT